MNFGSALGTGTKVFIGGVEVANYRYLGTAKVGAKLGLQQLTVQVGSLGNAALGMAHSKGYGPQQNGSPAVPGRDSACRRRPGRDLLGTLAAGTAYARGPAEGYERRRYRAEQAIRR